MRTLSLWKPYLAGVVLGDGWVSPRTLGLKVADEDFARTFASAVSAGYGFGPTCRRDERGYWLVRTSNRTGKFNSLLTFEPTSLAEIAEWLRGLFDSEGNATLSKSNVSENSWNRRVAIFSTTPATLDRAEQYLNSLAIVTLRYVENSSAGHKGSKTVLQLRVRPGEDNFARFASLVGSSIARKQAALDRMPLTYSNDYRSRAGKRGSATRIARRNAGGKY